MVLHEATAALDNATEREVTSAIEGLRGTTVKRCDTLVFLREGRVAAVGPCQRLLTESPELRAMAAPAPIGAP